MKIRELRAKAKMSQSQFAAYLQIPLSSLQNWESGRRQPPEYIFSLVEKALLYDGIISQKDLLTDEETEHIKYESYVTANEFIIQLLYALAEEYSVSQAKALEILDKINYWDAINDDETCCIWAHYGVADILSQVKEEYNAVLSRNNTKL